MAFGPAVLAMIVAGGLAACTAGQPVTPSPMAPSAATPVATMAAGTATPAATEPSRRPDPSPTPLPAAKPTPVPVPPKPTGVTFDTRAVVSADESIADLTQIVTWRAPRDAGVEIRVYGVTDCIAEPADPAPGASGPCLVAHTPLPASVRTLLATVPASDGKASWTWTQETGCDIGLAHDPAGPLYHAVVLAAYGTSGHSILAIAEPGGWWEPGPGDIVC